MRKQMENSVAWEKLGISDDFFVRKLMEAVEQAKKNREWRHEYMTLLMRDQENFEKGIEQGMLVMIENALLTTGSAEQTARLLKVDQEKVREVANQKGIYIAD